MRLADELLDHSHGIDAMAQSSAYDAALLAAVATGDIIAANAALAAGASVNAPSPHYVTPLIEAVGQKHFKMTEWLIDRGAVIDYVGMSEGSPLMLAAYMGAIEILQLLLVNDANSNLAMPDGGETA